VTSRRDPAPAVSSPTGTVTQNGQDELVQRFARRILLNTSVALVEDWTTQEVSSARSAENFSPQTQICFPYRGAFIWHVGGEDIVGDANQILFVPPGETFRLSQLHKDGCGELIITPRPDVIDELAGDHVRPRVHPLFRRRCRPSDPVLQRASMRFRQLVLAGELDELAAEELLLKLVMSALQDRRCSEALHPDTKRLVDRAKMFLSANWDRAVGLKDIATAIGASAAYLTSAFRRAEGVPLHAYLVQLRLARALVEIPHSTDLTELALHLGFSSHSHFTAAFRKSFGCTPSDFRQGTRKTISSCAVLASTAIENI
jgi:AraC family transcriptional regulator